jgi:hypothetical protein
MLVYAPLLILLPTGAGAAGVVLAFAVTIAGNRIPVVTRSLSSRWFRVGGSIALAAITLIALPGSISAIVSIA